MGMNDFSAHQQKIIKRYYQNIDSISLQKLGEMVTELYLAEGKKRERLWKNAAAAMEKLGVPPARINTIITGNKPEALATLVQEMQGKG
jgi:plasmid maintenance system antidote protein VapI